MKQGDLGKALKAIQSGLDDLNKKGQISNYTRNNFLADSLKNAIKLTLKKKEIYELDLKEQTLAKYFKKVARDISIEYEKKKKDKRKQSQLTKKISEYKKLEEKATKKGNKKLVKELKKRRTQLQTTKKLFEAKKKIEKETNKAMSKMAGKMSGGGHPLATVVIIAGKALIGAAKNILKPLTDIANKIIKLGVGIILKMSIGAYRYFTKLQSLSGKISANSGLIASESERMLSNLPKTMLGISMVGGTIEDVEKVFEKFSNTTNLNRVFSDKQYRDIIELGLGTALGSEGAAEFIGNFSNLGYSIDKTLEFTKYVRGKAMAINLNQSKVLNSINKTTVALTGFGIRSGLEGLTNLVLKAEKLRLNVSESVKNFTDAFANPEKAVELAGKMKLLGGKYAYYFGDPFVLLSKSILEPEQLTADLLESLKDKAFKGKNGFEISPQDRQIIKLVANEFGNDSEELFNVAIEQAKDLDKLKVMNERGIFELNLGSDRTELLKNLMTLNEDGSYSIRLSNGVVTRLSEIPSNNTILKTINQERKNDESAIMRKNLAERMGLVIDRFMIGFSQVFVELNKQFTNNNTMNNIDSVASSISEGLIGFINGEFINSLKSTLKSISEVVTGYLNELISIWTSEDPNQGFLAILKDSLDTTGGYLMKYMVRPMEYYSGKVVYSLGEAIHNNLPAISGRSTMAAGLRMQGDGLSGSFDSFGKSKLDELNKNIDFYNKEYAGADFENKLAKMGINATKGMFRHEKIKKQILKKIAGKGLAKFGLKQIAKKIPIIGFFVSAWDAIGYAMEGNYAQAGIAMASGVASTVPGVGTAISIGLDATNLAIDAMSDNTVENVQDAYVTPSGDIYKGTKGSVMDYLSLLLDNNSNPKEFNLVLEGNITNTYNNLVLDDKTVNESVALSSKLILKQMINNLG